MTLILEAKESLEILKVIAEKNNKIEKLKKMIEAKDALLVCYRINKRPSEELLNKLERLKKTLEE